jgi:hypothetical protein
MIGHSTFPKFHFAVPVGKPGQPWTQHWKYYQKSLLKKVCVWWGGGGVAVHRTHLFFAFASFCFFKDNAIYLKHLS